jgi:hypothetical protein
MDTLMNDTVSYDENKKKVARLFETPAVQSALVDFREIQNRLHRLWEFDSEHLIPKFGPLFASQDGRGLAALLLRTHSNVESLLCFKDVKHFQAIAILARTILELSVDIRLSQGSEEFANRLYWFSRLEHLRVCRRLKRIAADNGFLDAPEMTTMLSAMENASDEILAKAAALWPNFSDPFKIKHWSGLNLEQRASLAGHPFSRVYALWHIQMSWLNHGGTTGILELTPVALATDCTRNLSIVVELYETVLQQSATLFGLNQKIPS